MEFKPNTPVVTTTPTVEVTLSPQNALPVGPHRFRLVVTDEADNDSLPVEVTVIVLDTGRPTAVLDAPRTVTFGQSIQLSAARSTDPEGSALKKFTWTLLDREAPLPQPRPPIIEPVPVQPRPPIIEPVPIQPQPPIVPVQPRPPIV